MFIKSTSSRLPLQFTLANMLLFTATVAVLVGMSLRIQNLQAFLLISVIVGVAIAFAVLARETMFRSLVSFSLTYCLATTLAVHFWMILDLLPFCRLFSEFMLTAIAPIFFLLPTGVLYGVLLVSLLIMKQDIWRMRGTVLLVIYSELVFKWCMDFLVMLLP